jgi:thiol-disulfide isomerase/thioredoxin
MRTVLAGLLLLLLSSLALAQDKSTEAKLVKYDQLGEVIRQNKGKVVVVDLWTTDCIPCIKKFPELVELQDKYAADGLVVITLNVDSTVSDPDERDAIIKAIQDKLGGNNFSKTKVTVTNLILDEKPDLAREKLRFESVPSMYVFTREGKWWHFRFDGKDEFPRVKELVQDELKRK